MTIIISFFIFFHPRLLQSVDWEREEGAKWSEDPTLTLDSIIYLVV